MNIMGGLIPLVILVDPVYPLFHWLMMPFTGHLDRRKDLFNYP